MLRKKLNPLFLIDFYKAAHAEQYPGGITKIVSYYTPRMSRLAGQDKLVMFGLQGFIKEYLIDAFNENFFNQPKGEILREYARMFDYTLGENLVGYKKIAGLHDLGYLPIEINALPEGTRIPLRVPMFEITNTHPNFAWLVNTLETALSCTLWHAQISANVGYMYRQLVNKYYDISVDDAIPRARAVGDFSMRGQESIESATKSSAGFALSFVNTATVPMIAYMEAYYNANIEKEPVAFGLTSTEHSVMCSNFAVDGDEETLLKRLLTKTYRVASFNAVSDSYDYWNFVKVIIPACKDEILAHKGFLGVRGDSGDPVEIVTQTVFELWNIFGGTVNSKGYKVIDPHVKAVYGDSITPQRLERIYQILIKNRFACNNVSLASGSFSMQCLGEDNGEAIAALGLITDALMPLLMSGTADRVQKQIETVKAALEEGGSKPYTRDTFGIAIKATYCEINGKPVQIFKDPKTDTGNFKKSQRGCCVVYRDNRDFEDNIAYQDGFTFEEARQDPRNLMRPVFRDGKTLNEQSLSEIRNILHGGKF